MRLRLIRHATLRVEFAGLQLLVDPMLDETGARPAVENTANDRRNPLVPLPVPAAEVVAGVDAVLVTHLHADHLDTGAVEALDLGVPLFCQPEDEAALRERGFTDVRPVDAAAPFGEGLLISRTAARHGSGEVGERMAPASGFVLAADAEPTLYVAGDTIWCDEVAAALAAHQPDVTVVNAGAAQFLEGGPITMDAADVIDLAQGVPSTQVVAVHMEAINHCLLTRDELRRHLRRMGLAAWVLVPEDGEETLFD
ncbi:MAG TPA: MBL fold metallo-hydrolase [Thermoleophilaceae bacterium]